MLSETVCQKETESWNFIFNTSLPCEVHSYVIIAKHFGAIAFHYTCQVVQHAILSRADAKEKVL